MAERVGRAAKCWICCLITVGIFLFSGRVIAGPLQVESLGPVVEVPGGGDQVVGPITAFLTYQPANHWVAPYHIGNHGVVVGSTLAPGTTAAYGFVQFPGKNPILIQPLQAPIAGASIITAAMSVNSLGVVAGASVWNKGNVGLYHAITFFNGKTTDLGLPPKSKFNWTAGLAINDAGVVTGRAQQLDSTIRVVAERPFLYELGTMRLLDDPLGAICGGASYGLAINNAGQVLVIGQKNNGPVFTFLWDHGKYHQVPTNGFDSIEGFALSHSGAVTGVGAKPDAGHAFLSENGNTNDLGPFAPATTSCGFAIDGRGRVFGGAAPPPGGAFLYENGKFVDLNSLLPHGSNWRLLSVTGCNNHNQIVGIGLHAGQEVGFLATLP